MVFAELRRDGFGDPDAFLRSATRGEVRAIIQQRGHRSKRTGAVRISARAVGVSQWGKGSIVDPISELCRSSMLRHCQDGALVHLHG